MTAFFIVWILSSILSYGRLVASFYEIDEWYIDYLPPSPTHFELIASILFGPVAFLSGVVKFFVDGEKYFFKFSKSSLWKQFNEAT